ncbi:hypothetical protein Tco_0995810 [Tanacetum coccineum]
MTWCVRRFRGDGEGGVGDVRYDGDEVEMVASLWRGREWCRDGSEGGGVSVGDGGRRDVGGGTKKEKKEELMDGSLCVFCVCALWL